MQPDHDDNLVKLQNEVVRLERQWQELHAAKRESQGEAIAELSSYDNHPADLGTETFERAKDLALAERVRIDLEQARLALKRARAGDYGRCSRCGQEIAVERLEVLPTTMLCAKCAQQAAVAHDKLSRPVEEAALAPPFHRTRTDEMEEEPIGYDGEDATQELQRYGSSETPPDLPGTITYQDLTLAADEQLGAVDAMDRLAPADDPSSLDGSPLFAEPNEKARRIRKR